LAETYIDEDACLVRRETHFLATRLRLDVLAAPNASRNPTAKTAYIAMPPITTAE
jgi:uncharacterized protein YaiI (UPF0178 family)